MPSNINILCSDLLAFKSRRSLVLDAGKFIVSDVNVLWGKWSNAFIAAQPPLTTLGNELKGVLRAANAVLGLL